MVRFAPLDPTTVLSGFPDDTTDTQSRIPARTSRGATAKVDRALLDGASGWAAAAKRVHGFFGDGHVGSNDFMIAPSRSATGHAMIANDPHLGLSAPSTFWMVQVSVTAKDPTADLRFAGMAFPGIVGVILGFNEHVAWGATTAFYDVTDVYQETLTPDGSGVVFNGANVPLQTVREEILVQGGAPVEYDVPIVPQHGPLIPNIVNHQIAPLDPTKGALSVKWTGLQTTKDLTAITGFLRAKTVDDARTAVESFAVGAENWVIADTNGDTFYSSYAVLPTRDKRAFTWDPQTFSGTLPCFVLPGDGTAEWTGTIDKAFIPHVKNPSKGYLVTANNDQVGITLGNDPSSGTLPNGQPVFLSAFYDPGGALRSGRITSLVEGAKHGLALTDLAAIQADVHSNVAALVTPKILAAIAAAEAERAAPGTNPDLSVIVKDPRYPAAGMPAVAALFTQWSAAGFDTPQGVSLLDDGSLVTDPQELADSKAALLFNAWLPNMIHGTFDDELGLIETGEPPADVDLRQSLLYLMTADPTTLATYDPTVHDSALFDVLTTAGVETAREQPIAALLNAIDLVTARLGADQTQWAWGKLHTVTFESLVSLWSTPLDPPAGDPAFPNAVPRHGEDWVIDVGGLSDSFVDPRSSAYSVSYAVGPAQRFVVDMDPVNGPTAYNALPGGEVWDNTSKHFRDEAELWRRNQNHAVPTTHDAIVPGADEHVV